MEKIKVGIIGCGNISDIYLSNLSKRFEIIDLVGCADIDPSRADQKAAQYNITAYTVEELLNDEKVSIIVNLTIPKAHYEVSLRALEAGKHVYCEKPISINLEDGKKLLDIASSKELLIGNAPDTFMGAGIQTCRKLIDDGWLGTSIGATAFMMCHGHESWHPDPEFYYMNGGGPMFDMGPYYLTALINLLGPIASVSGSTKISFPQRTITSEKKKGQLINVEVPTHVSGLLNFKNGAVATVVTSFDVWAHHMPCIEIYGSEGSLMVPDPNCFDGPVYYMNRNSREWREIPLTHCYSENSRGLGVVDMAYSILNNRKNRANGDMAYHVLEVMHGIHISSNEGKTITLNSSCERPKAIASSTVEGFLD